MEYSICFVKLTTGSLTLPDINLELRSAESVVEFNDRDFRDVLSQFCTGVVVATGCLNGEPAGFAAQSFSSVSLDPPLVMLCPGKSSTSWPKLRDSGAFCINILGSDQQSICDIFAKTGVDKFSELAWHAGSTGSPIIEGSIAHIDCELEAEHDAGDHTIAIGRVNTITLSDSKRSPLLFLRGGYGQFISGAG